jgi:hypothetical protein
MSLFDFTFGLSAVILGLALTHLMTSLHGLVLAGRRVRWAPEPLLLAAIIFLVIVSVWLFHWSVRDMRETTIGLMLIEVLKLLLPFLAAAFVLPDRLPEEGPIDLYAHYDRTRPFTFGALILGLLLFWVHNMLVWSSQPGPPLTLREALAMAPWAYVAIYLLLIFVRRRWLNILVLTGCLIYYTWYIVPMPLKG